MQALLNWLAANPIMIFVLGCQAVFLAYLVPKMVRSYRDMKELDKAFKQSLADLQNRIKH